MASFLPIEGRRQSQPLSCGLSHHTQVDEYYEETPLPRITLVFWRSATARAALLKKSPNCCRNFSSASLQPLTATFWAKPLNPTLLLTCRREAAVQCSCV